MIRLSCSLALSNPKIHDAIHHFLAPAGDLSVGLRARAGIVLSGEPGYQSGLLVAFDGSASGDTHWPGGKQRQAAVESVSATDDRYERKRKIGRDVAPSTITV